MARPAPEPSLVIGARARDLRRSVGLIAWAALEELVLDATPQPRRGLSTQASARVLAARLGVSKDTAAHALRRLASAGLVRREDHRDANRGVFARSVYVIDAARLDQCGITRHTPMPTGSGRRGAADGVATLGTAQGSLFDIAVPEAQ